MKRGWELLALTLLCACAFGGIILVLHISKELNVTDGQVVGSAITAFASAIPVIVQAIRGIGQGQAMQSLVDHLAKSQPTGQLDGSDPQPVVIEQPEDKPVPVEDRG